MNLAARSMFDPDSRPMMVARIASQAAMLAFRARPATAVLSAAVLGYVVGRLVLK